METETAELNKKYLKNGRAVHVVSELPNGFLIQNVLEDNDTGGEYPDGETRFTDAVFDAAPTEVYDKSIALLQSQVAALRSEAETLRTAKYEMERTRSVIKGFPELEQFAKFAEAQEIWWLEGNEYPTDKPSRMRKPDNISAHISIRSGAIKVEWKYNYDKCGTVCFTEEEAIEKGRARIQTFMSSRDLNSYQFDSVIKSAKLYDVPITPEFAARVNGKRKAEIEERVQKLRNELAEQEKILVKFNLPQAA